jgi:outer membrane immunogenic protein
MEHPMKRELSSLSEIATRLQRGARSKLIIVSHRALLSCAALVAWAEPGGAANIAVQPPPYVSTWTGCYIGGHVSHAVATSDSIYSSPVSAALDVNGYFTAAQSTQNFNNEGAAGGGQVGCQQQTGVFLWGLEGDWSSFRNSSGQNFSNQFDEGGGVTFSQSYNQSISYSALWSLRGRFGIVVFDVYHLYLTVGAGGANAGYVYSGSFSETGGGGCTCGSIAGNVSIKPSGLALGVGAEWKAWSNLILGVEYLRYDLTSDTIVPFNTAQLNPLIALGDHVHTQKVEMVRARVSWLFNLGR